MRIQPKRVVLATMLSLILSGCNGDTWPLDGGPDAADASDAADATDGADAGDQDGDAPTEVDRDPPECTQAGTTCLIVAEGARACSCFKDGRSWRDDLAVKGMVEFVAGEHTLPDDGQTGPCDLFSYVEFGPERQVLTPISECQVTVTPEPWDITWHEFVQTFQLGEEQFVLTLTFTLATGDGQKAVEILPNFDFPGTLDSTFGPEPVDSAHSQFYRGCDYSHYKLYSYRARTADGDQIDLHKRKYTPDWVAGSQPANLVWARVELGGQTQEVEGYYRLVYAAEHHNWNETYAVLLDPPLGQAHAVALEDADYLQPFTLVILDADLEEIARKPLTSWEQLD
jgi:hypothetical protein